jgi:heme exporter protein C
MHAYANPARFTRFAQAVLPGLGLITLLLFGYGLYLALFVSPIDYQQRDSVRIMYIHVPAAWMAMGVYTTIVIASIVSLVWRHPLADVSARAAAPIGALFTALCLVTGALWGRPTWGTYWVWDARLTSVLVLLFIYLGYMALWSALEDRARAAKACAILALLGGVNLPIIKFSVDWWNTLHQPASVLRVGGPSIHPDMLLPLLVMAGAYLSYFSWSLLTRMLGELAAQRLEAGQHRQVSLAHTQYVQEEVSA